MVGRPSVDDDKRLFLSQVKTAMGAIGNERLMRLLGWAEDRYWRTHSELLNEGLILRGRGRGGSVLLVEAVLPPVDASIDPAPETSPPDPDGYFTESQLYEPARTVIEASWAKERAFDDAIVEVTATRGRSSGGIWTRPDVTLVASKSYHYLPGKVFDIVTFELKKADSVDIRGVFEALSHRQFATMSYVLFFTGGEAIGDSDPKLQRIREVASNHGVGVITASIMNDYDTWEELVEARRNVYNPEEANLFISSSLTDDTKTKIIKWQK